MAFRSLRREWWWCGAILALAVTLRVYHLVHENLWIDECYWLELSTGRDLEHKRLPGGVLFAPPPALTSLRSARPWRTIWTSLDDNTHPPLYPLLLRFWREGVGEGEAAARGLSVMASLVGILLVFLAARLLHGVAPACWAALLMSLAVPQLAEAQEIRNYTLVSAFAVGSCLALLLIEKRGVSAWRLAGLACGLTGALLTHYFVVPTLVALGLYGLIRLRGPARWWTLAAFGIAGLAFVALWAPFLGRQWPIFEESTWLVDRSGHRAMNMFLYVSTLPLRLFFEIPTFPAPSFFMASLPSLVVCSLSGVILYLVLALRVRTHRDLLLWILWIAVPLICFIGLDGVRATRHLFWIRYSVLISPGLCIGIAVVLCRLPRHLGRLPLGMLVLGCAFIDVGPYQVIHRKPDWATLAAYVAREARPGDLVAFESFVERDRYAWHVRTQYLSFSHYAPGLPYPVILLDGPISQATRLKLERAHAVWLITPDLSREAGQLLAGCSVWQRRRFRAGEVYQLAWQRPAAG